MRFFLILLLSCVTGFLALAQEIIWIRMMMYFTGGKPEVFAYVLGFYLGGIALGSWWTRKLCRKNIESILISKMFYFSSVIFYLSIGLISYFHNLFSEPIIIYIMVGVVTIFTGAILPLLAHVSINEEKVGQKVSFIYISNIVGASFGSGITGFYLMENYSITQIIFLVFSLGLMISLFIAFFSKTSKKKLGYVLLVGMSFLLIGVWHNNIYDSFLAKIHFKKDFAEKGNYKFINENRSGIIAVNQKKGRCDVIYGGGVYDSCFNINPDGYNEIDRAYAIVKLHPNPKKILVIGLSSGSWVRALSYSNVFEKIDVVEINHGYINLIKKYPEHSKIFKDSRITIHIDDGRRWLNRNKEKYDFILMNTTFHWRSYITNLVSSEFLKIIKNHLRSGGVVYYNTTGSNDIIYTAAKRFNHVVRYRSFVAASDSPFKINTEISKSFASTFIKGEEPILNQSKAIERIFKPMPDIREKFLSRNDLVEITDDNMAVEYKKSKTYFFNPKMSWAEMLKRL